MAHRKPTKRWQVERWLHKPSGTYLAIYYDKDEQLFWSRVADKAVEADTQAKARQQTTELANTLLASEDRWRRIIIVSPEDERSQVHYGGHSRDDTHNSPRVGFDCIRTWVLDAEDGCRYMRDWDRNPESQHRRENQEHFYDVKGLSRYLEGVELPYSDELWESLMALSQRLGLIQEELSRLIQRDQLAKLLTAGGVAQLMGATDDPPEEGR